MKKNLIILLMIVAFLSMGLRGRYNPVTGLTYYAVDTASDDTYLTRIDGIDKYTTGLVILLNPVVDNIDACTLNINSLGAKSIKKPSGGDPVTGWIDANDISPMCYDGTNFILMKMDSNP